MADLTDALNALVSIAAQTIYPNGTGQASVAGVPVKIYPGWPVGNVLDNDLAAGTCHVSIYPRDEESNTTRFSTDWQQQTVNSATLTATVTGATITIGGAVSVPQNVTVLTNGKAYSYGVQANDTLTTIATALAAMIAVDIAGTTSSGGVITLPSTARVSAARVGTSGTLIREVGRQKKVFQITVWADTPAHRDAVSGPLDSALRVAQFLTMPDGYGARMVYKNVHLSDSLQKSRIYRRDLFYSVEYATTQTDTAYTVTSVTENFSSMASDGSSLSPITTIVT